MPARQTQDVLKMLLGERIAEPIPFSLQPDRNSCRFVERHTALARAYAIMGAFFVVIGAAILIAAILMGNDATEDTPYPFLVGVLALCAWIVCGVVLLIASHSYRNRKRSLALDGAPTR